MRFDPQHRRSWSLIGNNVDLETGVLKVILVSLMNGAVIGITIVRQDKQRLIVFALAQFGDVVTNFLSNTFDIIEHADFPADELHDPYR